MASRGINKVIIVGNLGQDPEVRFMPNGGAVANFTVATSETWKDKQTGEQKEKTEWHRIVIYQRLAEIAGEYLKKGSKVYLEGRLQTRKWQNQQGVDQYTTEVVVNDMQMLDSRGQGGGQGYQAPQQAPQQSAPHGYQQPAAAPTGYQPAPQAAPAAQPHYQQPQQAAPQSGGYQKPAYQQPQQAAPQTGGYQKPAPAPRVNPQEPSIDFDDDIPF